MSSALDLLGAELGPAERGRLQAVMLPRQLTRGEVLIAEGELDQGLFVVEEGELSVLVGDVEIARIGPRSWVGEVALLDPGPASATVRAASDCVLLELRSETLGELVLTEPRIARAVVRALSGALARRLRESARRALADRAPSSPSPAVGSARGWFDRLFGGRRGGQA